MSESDKLRQEAKNLLLKLFNIPDGFSSGMVERVVDCIVGAAVLEVASLVQQSAQQSVHPTLPDLRHQCDLCNKDDGTHETWCIENRQSG